VQGIKKPQVLQELIFLIRTHKPGIICILETMVNEKHIKEILPKIGFNHFDYVPPINQSGGIAIPWNNGKNPCICNLKRTLSYPYVSSRYN